MAALSEQDVQILRLLTSGKNSPEIAKSLQTSLTPCAITCTTSTTSCGPTIAWKCTPFSASWSSSLRFLPSIPPRARLEFSFDPGVVRHDGCLLCEYERTISKSRPE